MAPGDAAYLNLLLADARLPTGSHTQSAGVEPAFASGMRTDQVPGYLTVRLRTVTEVEAAAAVVARHRWSASAPGERAAALRAVDAAWRARTASDALRAASDLLGRSYLRMAAAVWDVSDLDGARAVRSPRDAWCRAVVLGATAAVVGLDAAAVARLIAYEDRADGAGGGREAPTLRPQRRGAVGGGGRPRGAGSGRAGRRSHRRRADPGPGRTADRALGAATRVRRQEVVPCLNRR